ncbi:MAG: M50 family metallopeptidase [Acidipropionibacterium sp.]|nr:M50 family metallopeptidase [Acidipropionibacterium sp.]
MDWRRILDELLARLGSSLTAVDPVTGRWLLAAVGLAVGTVATPPAWRLVRPVVALVHEVGHGLVGLLCGRRFSGFVISPDMSGHTVTVGRRAGPGTVLTAAAGYPMPALIGALAIQAAVQGRAGIVLVGVLLALIAVLVRVRSLFTAAWVLALIAADGLLWWSGTTPWSAAAVVWLGAILLIGAWRHLIAVALHGDAGQDPGVLARLTRVPASIWILLLAMPMLACTWWAWTGLSVPLKPHWAAGEASGCADRPQSAGEARRLPVGPSPPGVTKLQAVMTGPSGVTDSPDVEPGGGRRCADLAGLGVCPAEFWPPSAPCRCS